MADATAVFFDELGKLGHVPILRRANGTIRFDLKDKTKTDRWLVTVRKGDLSVSRKNTRADCIVSTDKALFDGVTSGKKNALAAMLRGEINVEGDVQLLVLFQRLLPGSPGAVGATAAGYAGRPQ
jgi:ubiquinone biosynthesis protein UbiJ